MTDEEITSLRLRIEGGVQAVGFRNHVIAEARKLSLDGWVRNRSDGSVEALISGPTRDVEAMVQACAKGPPGAKVTSIDLHNSEPPEQKGFHRRPTL